MFPALASNDHAYLNCGSSGPPPYHVIEAMRAADDAVSTTTEHPGCLMPLHALAKRFGVKVSLIPRP